MTNNMALSLSKEGLDEVGWSYVRIVRRYCKISPDLLRYTADFGNTSHLLRHTAHRVWNMIQDIHPEVTHYHGELVSHMLGFTRDCRHTLRQDCNQLASLARGAQQNKHLLERNGQDFMKKAVDVVTEEVYLWSVFQAALLLDAFTDTSMTGTDLFKSFIESRLNSLSSRTHKAPWLIKYATSLNPSDQLRPPNTMPNLVLDHWRTRADDKGNISACGYFRNLPVYPWSNAVLFHQVQCSIQLTENQFWGTALDVYGSSIIKGEIGQDGTSVRFTKVYVSATNWTPKDWVCSGCITPCGILGEFTFKYEPDDINLDRGLFGIWLPEYQSATFEDQFDELRCSGTLLSCAPPEFAV